MTTSDDGNIRLYDADFKLIQNKHAPGGSQPLGVAFSPDGHTIAVGYYDSTRVDVLSADDLSLLFSANTDGVDKGDLGKVARSTDGRCLYAGGRYYVSDYCPILCWDKGGRGKVKEFRIATNTIMNIAPLADGKLAVGAGGPLVGVVRDAGVVIWKYQGGIADFRAQIGTQCIRLSRNGDRVQFGFERWGKPPACFSLTDSQLTLDPPEDKCLLGPITEAKGLNITDWVNRYTPKLDGTRLELWDNEKSRSLAISPDGSCFILGTEWFLRCFDRKGKEVWRVDAPGIAWAVNISGDGRLAVAGFGDGTLRWYRMSDGKELLALFVRPDDKRWVVWTPEGYYNASVGGEDLIGWHLNHGADVSPEFFGASRFRQQFYCPDVIAGTKLPGNHYRKEPERLQRTGAVLRQLGRDSRLVQTQAVRAGYRCE
ncbi:MAG: repeat, subgroup [Candidatus Brocadiaceae bacterium]|nr:repeat, subgroup [Candidatus Brocadiaceae bacterium]